MTTQDAAVQTSSKRLKLSEKILELQRENCILKKRLHRREERLTSIQSILQSLKSNNYSTDGLENVLNNNFNDFSLDLLRNELKNNQLSPYGRRYSASIRQFALTLYFYSKRAYEFLRSKLSLPHSSLMRQWLSNYNIEPGFISEVFTYLKDEACKKDYLKDVALIFDAMAIRKRIVYDKKSDKMRWHVDFGGIAVKNSEELATEVLVLLIVSYTTKFKCPIAFFVINKMPSTLQSQII